MKIFSRNVVRWKTQQKCGLKRAWRAASAISTAASTEPDDRMGLAGGVGEPNDVLDGATLCASLLSVSSENRVSRMVSAVSREPEARAEPLAAEPLKK